MNKEEGIAFFFDATPNSSGLIIHDDKMVFQIAFV